LYDYIIIWYNMGFSKNSSYLKNIIINGEFK